jgi:hypothetical protein
MVGRKFGNIVVIEKSSSGKFPGSYWLCICGCGTQKKIRGCHLTSGHTLSCGCSRKDFSYRPAFKQLFSNYKSQAKSRGLIFDLSIDDFEALTKRPCFYCGVLLSMTARKRNSSYRYNGVDRVNNSIGYTVENCVSCCGTHNHMKCDLSHEDFIAACRAVVNHFDSQSPKKVGE